jgi:hypothetical protein
MAVVALVGTAAACGKKAADTAGTTPQEHTSHNSGHESHAAEEAGAAAEEQKQEHEHSEGDMAEETALGDGVQAVMAVPADEPKAGQDTELTLRILDEAGKPLENFSISHEKLLHLIIVSEDLRDFRHIHPGYDGEGVFRVITQFANGGRYKWFADFVPVGGETLTRIGWLTVDGKPLYDTPAAAPDSQLVQAADGIQAELVLSDTKPGADTQLTFRFKDEKTGKEIDDLQPYLGAAGHVVILSGDAETYLHVHPVDEQSGGPEARFQTEFPSAGIYKIWGQFQRDGRVVTFPYVVQIG